VVKHIKQKFLTAIAIAILFLSLSLLLTGTSWASASIDSEVVPVIERVEDKQVAEQAQTIQASHKIGQPAPSTQSKTSKNEDKEDIARIGQFLHGLEAKLDIEKIAQTVFQQISQNQWGWGILGVLVYIVLLLPLFWLKPLWLLRINEWVNRHSPFTTVNQKIGDTTVMGIVFRTVISSLLLSYRPRVLDAWVEKNIGKAKDGFEEIDTVKKRKIHISSVPVNLNDKLVQCLTAKDLQPTFERNPTRLLIWGEGGAGKTSLGCQIGKWAMAEDKAELLCKHRMLPVLIEEELGGEQRFTEAIRQQLKILLDESEPISVELLEQLLKQQRILVIVDHLSEMSEATRQAIPFKEPEFPVKALVVTSRLEEKLDGGNKTTIKPLRVEGNRLSSFMDAYLTQLGKRELFDDPEYFNTCRELSLMVMVGKRDITVLLAKLYADQLIAKKEGSQTDDLPNNIPDLMLCYLNRLNDSVEEENKPDNLTVHADVKAIAWQCLKREYKPQSANYEDVLKAIASPNMDDDDKKDKAKVRLKYLEKRLCLIRTKEPGDKVLFDLDPLAEYLAGLYLVDDCREDEEKWREFLTEVDSKSGAPEAIKGFLLVVRDCYLAKVPDAKVTDFVPEELGRRTDLDPEKVEQAQLKQRIERLKSQLTVPEAEDRIHAAKELRKIGSAAKDAVPTLVNALKDEEISVRVRAAEALAVIGSTAPDIFPVLMEGMKDTNREVRQSAVYALGKIVSEVKEAFPALIKALKDPIKEVRWTALVALRQIDPEPQAAVPDLIKALKNEDKDFRLGAAIGLGGIGSEAKAAVPDLMEALKDESKYVRRFAFLALGEIGWKAKLGIPDLIEALEDEDYEVRNAAWREFRKAVEEAFKKIIRREKR
jgi:HEAT repeat protein